MDKITERLQALRQSLETIEMIADEMLGQEVHDIEWADVKVVILNALNYEENNEEGESK